MKNITFFLLLLAISGVSSGAQAMGLFNSISNATGLDNKAFAMIGLDKAKIKETIAKKKTEKFKKEEDDLKKEESEVKGDKTKKDAYDLKKKAYDEKIKKFDDASADLLDKQLTLTNVTSAAKNPTGLFTSLKTDATDMGLKLSDIIDQNSDTFKKVPEPLKTQISGYLK